MYYGISAVDVTSRGSCHGGMTGYGLIDVSPPTSEDSWTVAED